MDWIEVQNAFYPYEPIPIPPDKLDDWYVERPRSPYRQLLKRLDPRRFPERYVLVGHRSSGKTTELIKLTAELRKTHDYFVVYIPLEYNLDISKVNPVEVLFLMGIAVYKVAYEELPNKPDEAVLRKLEDSLTTLVREETENKDFSLNLPDLIKNIICLGASMVAPGPASQLLDQMFKSFTFVSGTDVKLVRKLEVQPRIKEIADAVNALIEDVGRKAGRPVILLVDGLDKFEPGAVDLIKLNFLENPHLATIGCRVIYVGPMILYYGVPFANVRTRFRVLELPNIMIHDRDRNPIDSGYETMRKMVRNRLASLDYEPHQVIRPEALDLLIRNSGGVARDLMLLISEAVLTADIAGEEHIDVPIAKQAVADFRRKYEAALTPAYRKVLKEVERTKQRTDDPLCDELVLSNFILSYIDEEGEIWFDVHSVLW